MCKALGGCQGHCRPPTMTPSADCGTYPEVRKELTMGCACCEFGLRGRRQVQGESRVIAGLANPPSSSGKHGTWMTVSRSFVHRHAHHARTTCDTGFVPRNQNRWSSCCRRGDSFPVGCFAWSRERCVGLGLWSRLSRQLCPACGCMHGLPCANAVIFCLRCRSLHFSLRRGGCRMPSDASGTGPGVRAPCGWSLSWGVGVWGGIGVAGARNGDDAGFHATAAGPVRPDVLPGTR